MQQNVGGCNQFYDVKYSSQLEFNEGIQNEYCDR